MSHYPRASCLRRWRAHPLACCPRDALHGPPALQPWHETSYQAAPAVTRTVPVASGSGLRPAKRSPPPRSCLLAGWLLPAALPRDRASHARTRRVLSASAPPDVRPGSRAAVVLAQMLLPLALTPFRARLATTIPVLLPAAGKVRLHSRCCHFRSPNSQDTAAAAVTAAA